MEVKAITRFARISASKARDLAAEIQGKTVEEAVNITQFSHRKAATLIGKTLKSAIANAENNAELAVESLWVREAVVEEGPALKRYWARARGMVSPVKKRTSHIKITLTDKKG